MADTYTTLSNMIVPDVFTRATQEATVSKNALIQSGLVEDLSNTVDWGQVRGGKVINMPFFKPLSGSSQLLPSDGTTELEVNNITQANEVAVIQARGENWASVDLARFFTGEDPMGAIANQVGQYWSDDLNTNVFSVLKGAFDMAGMSSKVNDITALTEGSNEITAQGFFDTIQNGMGDAKSKVSAIMMHSAVENYLRKNDLIQYVMDTTVGIELPTAFGKRVFVDDTLTLGAGDYITIAAAPGAIAYGTKDGGRDTEVYRKEAAGVDGLISRQHRIVHPRGLSWTGSASAVAGPTNTELETGTNWSLVAESKNVPLVAMKHKI